MANMISIHEEIQRNERRMKVWLYVSIVTAALVLAKLIVWVGGTH